MNTSLYSVIAYFYLLADGKTKITTNRVTDHIFSIKRHDGDTFWVDSYFYVHEDPNKHQIKSFVSILNGDDLEIHAEDYPKKVYSLSDLHKRKQ